MDYSQLVKIPGTEPGHEFLVIGEDNEKGFRGAIRFWIAARLHTPYTEIGFRFRVERQPEAPEVANFPHAIKSAYPEVAFMSGSPRHGSITGAIRAKISATEYKQLVETLVSSGAFSVVYDSLKAGFPTMNFVFSREDFTAFFAAEVLRWGETLNLPKLTATEDPTIDVHVDYVKEPNAPDAMDALIAPPSEKNAELVKSILSEEGEVQPPVLDGAPANDEVDQMVASKPEGMTDEQATAIAEVVAGGNLSKEAMEKAINALGEAIENGAVEAPGLKKPKKKSASLKLLSSPKQEGSES